MAANADADAFWSGPAGAKWIEHETEQDHFLSEVAAAVLEKASLLRGERVLDVGSGTGAVALLAAEAVGEQGAVLATDIAAPFVARVAERAKAYPQVLTHLGDAQSTAWPETGFDAAVSRFGVMFFSEPVAAFRNIALALRPGGRIVFAAWGRTEDNPYWQIARDMVADRYGEGPRPEPNAPGPMGLANKDWAMAQLRAAGLARVEVDTRAVNLLHEGGAAGVASLGLRIGPAARALAEAEASEADHAAFLMEATERFAAYEADGVARVPAVVHLFTAERA